MGFVVPAAHSLHMAPDAGGAHTAHVGPDQLLRHVQTHLLFLIAVLMLRLLHVALLHCSGGGTELEFPG